MIGQASLGGENVKGSKNITKTARKPLGDVSSYQKAKPTFIKCKLAKPANVKSLPKGKHQVLLEELKAQKCKEWVHLEIE